MAAIEGRRGWFVDAVSLRLRSGEVRSYGGSGGAPTAPFELHDGEGIVSVEQWGAHDYLGSRLLFSTSLGRQTEIVGERHAPGAITPTRAHSAVAVDSGEEIIGLTFDVSPERFEPL